MKKQKIIRILVMATMGLFLSACGKETGDVMETYQAVADEDPFLMDAGYSVPELTLDGVLDDTQWDVIEEISFGNKYVTATVKAFYGEDGIYIGATIADEDLWTTDESETKNSAFEMYFNTVERGGTYPTERCWRLFVDASGVSNTRVGNNAKGSWAVVEYMGEQYAVSVDGTLNDDVADKGYTVEVFIPYSFMGGESQVNYGMAFGVVCCREGERVAWCGIENVDPQIPDTYLRLQRDTNSLKTRQKNNYATYKVDGKDDDTIWKNRRIYTYANGLVTVSSAFAEEGLYLFYEVTDDKVYGDSKAIHQNDSVEVYIDSLKNGGKVAQTDDIQIGVDVLGQIVLKRGNGSGWSSSIDDVFAGIQIIDGTLNGEASGYNVELFIPWSDLKMEKAPESMNISFGMVDYDGADRNSEKWKSWKGIGSDPQVPNNYIQITASGVAGSKPNPPASEVVLDGVLDDALWEKSQLTTYRSAKVFWVWTENGCYFAFDVTDKNVSTGNTTVYKNSCIEVYLDYLLNGGAPGEDDRTIIIDAAGGVLLKKGTEGSYKTHYSKAIQSAAKQTDFGYSVELYVPWAEFDGTKPEKMGVAFGQVYVFPNTGKQWYDDGFCKDPQTPDLYSILTETGISRRK